VPKAKAIPAHEEKGKHICDHPGCGKDFKRAGQYPILQGTSRCIADIGADELYMDRTTATPRQSPWKTATSSRIFTLDLRLRFGVGFVKAVFAA